MDSNVVTSKFSSFSTIGCTIVAGADQGQGAWHSWIKIATMSGSRIRNKMAIDENFDPKNCYSIAKVTHFVWKKRPP